MPQKLLKYKNYDIHSITTATPDGRKNANIAMWVMQTAMGGKNLCVALDKTDYTLELVKESGVLNVNLLAEEQTRLIAKLGRRSGRDVDKFKNLPYFLDERGCPYLTEAIGYIQCRVTGYADGGDHELVLCDVLKQTVLHPEKPVMTHHFLRKKGLVRG
jgi:flavin reductase (DIM6/NTAB) family NADH-FMN oxidoreductase RutF